MTRLVNRLLLSYGRLRRGMTLGVRGVVVDDADRVLLVRHTYLPGWYLPGGGVEPGEGAQEALGRELREEAGVVLLDPPEILGVYLNPAAARRDHVVVYVCRSWRQRVPKRRSFEIADCRFFPLRGLPAEVSSATRRRVAEFLGEAGPASVW